MAAVLAACAVEEEEPLAEAEQASWGAYRIANLRPSRGTTYYVEPRFLLESAEAWGPQTLLLAIDRHVSPQVSIQRSPGVQLSKDKITKTLQDSVGFSLSEELELTASSSTVVSQGWYERMEAYPTFQTVAWDLVQDDVWGARKLASGTVYRPMGVYFQTVVVVRGTGEQGQSDTPRQPGSITAIGQPVLGAEATRD